MEKAAAISALGALAQETRLDVFRLLVERGPEGLPAGAIAGALDLPAATLSFHLKTLKDAGMLRRARNGRELVYAADFPHMEALLRFLTDNCCQGACRPPVQP
ncbi:MAG: metalloregulator ArsR/SmtB family transcription factor [Alphaproteobacteria bacterium]|nr:metalloregulator ArsR/SmtB family transcription factor [Alphaproteobacteria bacterium]